MTEASIAAIDVNSDSSGVVPPKVFRDHELAETVEYLDFSKSEMDSYTTAFAGRMARFSSGGTSWVASCIKASGSVVSPCKGAENLAAAGTRECLAAPASAEDAGSDF